MKVYALVVCLLLTAEVGSTDAPPFCWKAVVDGSVESIEPPVGNVLPVGANDIFGLDIETGEIVWYVDYYGPTCTDIESDAGVLFTGPKAFAIDVRTGKILWDLWESKELYGGYHAVGYGKLYATEAGQCFAIDDARFGKGTSIMAFDEFTGELLWTFDTLSDTYSDIAVGGGLVLCGSSNCTVYALDHETGEVVWTQKTTDWASVYPVIEGGRALVYSARTLICVDITTGNIIWEKPFHYTEAVLNGRVYASTESGYACLDIRDGTTLWTYEQLVKEWSELSDAAVKGDLFVFGDSTVLVALDAYTGEERWVYDTNELISCRPLILSNFIVVGTEEAHVIALGNPPHTEVPPCEEKLDSVKQLLFKKDYENALEMLEDARTSCSVESYVEIDALSDYIYTQQEKASRIRIFAVVGVVGVVFLICGALIAGRLRKRNLLQ